MTILFGLACLFLQGFFAGSETSFTKANWIRLNTWSRNKRFGAAQAQKLLENKEKVLVCTLIGTNLSVVLASMFLVDYFATNFGMRYVGFATILVIALSLIFSEFLPKTIAQAFPDHWASIVSYPLSWTMKIFSPPSELLYRLAIGITPKPKLDSKNQTALSESGRPEKRKRFGVIQNESMRSTRDDATKFYQVISRKDFIVVLREYFRTDKKDRFGEQSNKERTYLAGIAYRLFEFSRIKVAEVAIPLTRVVVVPEDTSLANLYAAIKKFAYSRYPVYQGTPENITGVIHTKDLLFLPRKRIRRAYVVSAQARAMEVLTEMRQRGEHLAIVRDETDKVIGIVTLEDLVEELVGEIRSED